MLNIADIANLQQMETGTFYGDEWGEVDTRFLYGALNALSLLDMIELVDVPKAVNYVRLCANFDGGFGVSPGAESHAGQIFACLGALSIAGRLDLVDQDRLAGWLSKRQLEGGGLNGRPEKLEDVCYSWWVLSSLAMINRIHWIDSDKLIKFILKCQVRTHWPQNSHGHLQVLSVHRIHLWEALQTGPEIWLMCSTLISRLRD